MPSKYWATWREIFCSSWTDVRYWAPLIDRPSSMRAQLNGSTSDSVTARPSRASQSAMAQALPQAHWLTKCVVKAVAVDVERGPLDLVPERLAEVGRFPDRGHTGPLDLAPGRRRRHDRDAQPGRRRWRPRRRRRARAAAAPSRDPRGRGRP